MAAGDVTNRKYVTVGHPGGTTDSKLVTINLEFGSPGTGKITVTASQLGLKQIIGFCGGIWGAATGVGQMINSTTAYVSGGVTSIDLEMLTDASALVDDTVSMLFWGI